MTVSIKLPMPLAAFCSQLNSKSWPENLEKEFILSQNNFTPLINLP